MCTGCASTAGLANTLSIGVLVQAGVLVHTAADAEQRGMWCVCAHVLHGQESRSVPHTCQHIRVYVHMHVSVNSPENWTPSPAEHELVDRANASVHHPVLSQQLCPVSAEVIGPKSSCARGLMPAGSPCSAAVPRLETPARSKRRTQGIAKPCLSQPQQCDARP